MNEQQVKAESEPSGRLREGVIAAVPIALGMLALAFLPEGDRVSSGFPSPDSPAFFPTLISLLLIGLGLALLARTRISAEIALTTHEPIERLPALITAALLVFYWVALNPAGFVVSSAVVILGLGYVFRERFNWRVLAFALAFPLIVDFTFRRAANVWLPPAPWF
jgi:hypothetical protein